MRDWAAAASRQGSAAAACPPGWAAASPRATAGSRRRRRRTGCYRDRAPADGRRPGRDGPWSVHPAHPGRPVRPDGRRPANRDAAEPSRGPAGADACRARRAAAERGARLPGCGLPGRRGRRPPARPSEPRRAARRRPPRCRGRSPAWRPGRARGPDGRRPAAWAGPKRGPVRGPRATSARWAPRQPERHWWDDAAGSDARSSGYGVRPERSKRSRRAPERYCRSTPRGHHGAAGPRGPRRCWTLI
jgi:hypothetical protein